MKDKIKVGVIGVGGRGHGMIGTIDDMQEDVQIIGVCDVYQDRVENAQKRVEEAFRDEAGWAKMAMLNVAKSGKFSSDRTIEEYVQDIWHLDKVTVEM